MTTMSQDSTPDCLTDPKAEMRQIKASAGSGKTHRLTQAFLKTLSRCSTNPAPAGMNGAEDQGACSAVPQDDWRSIMAITFTNAAASEMQDRVLSALKETALGLRKPGGADDPGITPKEAGQWVERIVRDRSSLNISTIDSLLNLIVRMSALSLNIPPDFTPVFATEDILTPYWEQFSNEAWLDNKENKALIAEICRSIVSFDDFSSFSANDVIVRKLNTLMPMLIRDALDDLTDAEAFQKEDGQGYLPRMRQRLCQNALILQQAGGTTPAGAQRALVYHKSFARALDKVVDGIRSALSLAGADADNPESLPLKAYAALAFDKYLFSSEYWKKEEPVTVKSSCPVPDDLLAAFKDFTSAVRDYLCLDHMYRQTKTHAALLSLGREIFKRYEANVQMEGQVFNDRIPLLVQKILSDESGVSDAVLRLGTSIRHFLIDEFQDTSREHWDALRPLVVEALSNGGSFTWVGDVKQAIYGFRGGDSQLFDDVAKEEALVRMLENASPGSAPDGGGQARGSLERLTLEKNWRSKKEVIDFNNALFAPLEDAGLAAEVLKQCVSEKKVPLLQRSCQEAGSLCQDAEPCDTLLSYMAGKVQQAYTGARQDPCPNTTNGGKVYLVHFAGSGAGSAGDGLADGNDDSDDCALLADEETKAAGRCILASHIRDGRPWSDFLVLVRKNSDAAAIARYLSSINIPVITENSLVLAEHPLINQTLALLAFLRAPEDDLAFWTLITSSLLFINDPDTGLHAGMDDEELLALVRSKKRTDDIPLYQLWREAHPKLWQQILEPLVEAARTMTPYDLVSDWYSHIHICEHYQDAAPFLRRFLEILHAARQKGLITVARFLDYWNEQGTQEKMPMPEYIDAVNIMTIHKAKGLEKKVVLIPKTSSRARTSSAAAPVEYSFLDEAGAKKTVRSLCSVQDIFPVHTYNTLREAFESINNFYVACTRAKEELYLFVREKPAGDGRMLAKLIELAGFAGQDAGGSGDASAAFLCRKNWEEWDRELACFAGSGSGSDIAADGGTDSAPAPARAEAEDENEAREDGTAAAPQTMPQTIPEAAGPAGTNAGGTAGDPSPAQGTALPGESACWHPLSWVPELNMHFSFLDESHPRDLAREEGVFIHACLEDLARLPQDNLLSKESRIEQILAIRARKSPWLAEREGFRERVRAELDWFMAQAERFGWLENSLPEQGLSLGGRIMRMDLYIPDAQTPVVLEYKTGLTDDEFMADHHAQVQSYLACLIRAQEKSPVSPIGIVVYLKRRRMHIVLPNGSSFASSAVKGSGAHAALCTPDELEDALQSLKSQAQSRA